MRFLRKNKHPLLLEQYFRKTVSKKTVEKWKELGGSIGESSYGGFKVNQLKLGLQHGVIFKIGAYCSFAKGVELNLSNNHDVESISTYPFELNFQGNWIEATKVKKTYSKGNIEIGSDVWLANKVEVMSGVKIGHGAVVALGAVVTKDIPPYEIWGGIPAKKLRDRFPEEQKQQLLKSEWWNLPLEKVKVLSPLLAQNDVAAFIAKVEELKAS